MNPAIETETVIATTKVVTALDHLKNNRIEYLILMVITHMLGLTSVVIEKAQGVCY